MHFRCTRSLLSFLTPVIITLVFWASDAVDKPNVLFLIVDDMNHYGFLHEQPGFKTPELDSFRETAVTFPNAVCNAPACVPSRASLFSGLYPYTTGAYLNGCDPWEKPVMNGVESLPESFKRAGYTVWAGGKVFHSPITTERKNKAFCNEPKGGGFGPFLTEDQQVKSDTDKWSKWWGAGAWDGNDTDFPDTRNATDAIAFLEEKHEAPFFLVLGLWRPHTPFTAPQRFFELYDKDSLSFPPSGFQSGDLSDVPEKGIEISRIWGQRWEASGESKLEEWRDILWGYAACTSYADDTTGRVLKALDQSDYADDTIVIFVSDNGYHVGEKEHFEKSTLWSASARIPFAVRLPGNKNGGTISNATVGLIDLFPTLVDYCDLPSPSQELDGLSIRKVLEKPKSKWKRPAITVFEEKYFSATDGEYRYIQYDDGTEELYHRSKDPHEFQNLASNPELKPIKARFQKWIPEKWEISLGGRKG